jgi:hypothetical protein
MIALAIDVCSFCSGAMAQSHVRRSSYVVDENEAHWMEARLLLAPGCALTMSLSILPE